MNIKIINNKKFKNDLFFMLFIIVLPFLFYLYRVVPEDIVVWEVGFLKINSGYFEYVESYIWQLFVKLFTLGILSAWFITCEHKWRYILFFPILMEIYKIFGVINLTNHSVEVKFTLWNVISDVLFWISFIVFAIYINILIFISIKLNYKPLNEQINKEINAQLSEITKFNNIDYKLIENELLVLKSQKKVIDRKEYLMKLIVLRDKLVV